MEEHKRIQKKTPNQIINLIRHLSDPGGILTHNLLIRSQMLYTVEPRGHCIDER